ncbi:MAG: hypothetical protein HY289_11220 [Planctomycetes bacterium]|nr:hypothetical protein [Planctomycetota bacterium]
MTAMVPGIYAHGKIELLQTPVGIRDGKVRVIVIEEDEKRPSRQMQFGKYSEGRLSTEEDFRIAEWHGPKEWE